VWRIMGSQAEVFTILCNNSKLVVSFVRFHGSPRFAFLKIKNCRLAPIPGAYRRTTIKRVSVVDLILRFRVLGWETDERVMNQLGSSSNERCSF
jgi:hypothetical protein